jgi:anti-sigma factor ChrR (cupin superfamily)
MELMCERSILEKRQIIETKNEELRAYNRYGKVSSGLKWLPLSKDENLEHEVFIIRFEAESSSNLHQHKGYEEFYVLDGELIDADGKVFKKGDYIKFEKGSEHSSYSKTGCTLLVILYGGMNELIESN